MYGFPFRFCFGLGFCEEWGLTGAYGKRRFVRSGMDGWEFWRLIPLDSFLQIYVLFLVHFRFALKSRKMMEGIVISGHVGESLSKVTLVVTFFLHPVDDSGS